MNDRDRDLQEIAVTAVRAARVCRRISCTDDDFEKDRLAMLTTRWLESISDLIDKLRNITWENNDVRQIFAGTGCGTEIAAADESPPDIAIVQAYA